MNFDTRLAAMEDRYGYDSVHDFLYGCEVRDYEKNPDEVLELLDELEALDE